MKLLILLILGIWIGMLIGISFVEAPLKFRAPNITVPLGLGIGKLVFNALNKFEIVFSLGVLFWLFQEFRNLDNLITLTFIVLVFIVALQTFWLLASLDARANNVMNGISVEKSNHHLYYIIMEVTKVVLLFFAFIKTFKHA